MSRAASILVPSQLPKATDSYIHTFVFAMRDQVFHDFFTGLDTLDECLHRGAVLRFRLLCDVQQLNPRRQKNIRQWLRPPSDEFMEQLEIRAVEVLGSERALHMSRMFTHSFSNTSKIFQRFNAKITQHDAVKLLFLGSKLMGCAAENDVLSMLWMMLLYRDLELPAPEVLDTLYVRFIDVAADYLTQAGTLLRDAAPRTPSPMLEDSSFDWLNRHVRLATPSALLMGMLHEDPSVAMIRLTVRTDPEIAGMESLEIHALVTADPVAVEERLMQQMLRAGLLGVQSDATGAAWFLRVSSAG